MPNPNPPELPEEAVGHVTAHLREYMEFDGPRKPEEAEPLAIALVAKALSAIEEKVRRDLLNDPVRISLCNACGHVDDPRRSSCANCGAQMQYISKSLVDLARKQRDGELRERLREAMEGLERFDPEKDDSDYGFALGQLDPIMVPYDHGMRGDWLRRADVIAALDSEADRG